MRAMIFVPIAIGVANRFGYSVVSLALPVAFLIEHVYVLPFNHCGCPALRDLIVTVSAMRSGTGSP